MTLAERIAKARRGTEGLAALAPEEVPPSLDDAYDLQDTVNAILVRQGFGPPAGYKIGCTTAVMQAVVGVDHPSAGVIFAPTIHQSGARLKRSRFRRLGVECEIGVRMGRDLAPSQTPYTREQVAEAVAAYLPAMEIVDDRYPNLPTPNAAVFIADNFYGAGAVVGEPATALSADDLPAVEAVLRVDGAEVGRGLGEQVLGHPLQALAWLASHLSRRGRGLKAGDLVLTGSLVATYWVPPDATRIETLHHPLGPVTVTIDP